MAEKLVPGDSLSTEVYEKFNKLVDEVNNLDKGEYILKLSGESGTLTKEQYEQCVRPNTTIEWSNNSGGTIIYKSWRFISPTYYFKSIYVDEDECINNIIEIDQINHSWKRDSMTYSGNGSGGSVVSVKQTLTSGTEIGSITVNGVETKLYAPEGSGTETEKPSIINYVNELPTEDIDENVHYMVIETVESWVDGVKNQMPNPSEFRPELLSGIPITIHMVDKLPANPEYATDSYTAPTKMVFYYLVSGEPLFEINDNRLYAYIPEGTLPMTGENLSNTWQRVATFLVGSFMMSDRGFISEYDIDKAYLQHNNMYFFVTGKLYRYDNGWKVVEKESDSVGDAIIDVERLPTENINKNSFYAVPELEVYTLAAGEKNSLMGAPVTIHSVYVLPETGEPFIDNAFELSKIVVYHQRSDNRVYLFITTSLGATEDRWVTSEEFNLPCEVISSDEEATDSETLYVVIKPTGKRELVWYNNGWEKVQAGDEQNSGGNGASKFFTFNAEGKLSDDNTYVELDTTNTQLVDEMFDYIKSRRTKLNTMSIRLVINARISDVAVDIATDMNYITIYPTVAIVHSIQGYVGGSWLYINSSNSDIPARLGMTGTGIINTLYQQPITVTITT